MTSTTSTDRGRSCAAAPLGSRYRRSTVIIMPRRRILPPCAWRGLYRHTFLTRVLQAHKQMVTALSYAGYDCAHIFGEGGHSRRHGGSVFPQTMVWALGGDGAVFEPAEMTAKL